MINFFDGKMQIIVSALLSYQIAVLIKRHFERRFVGCEVPYMHGMGFTGIKAVHDDCQVRATVSSEVRASSTWRCVGKFESMLGEGISRRQGNLNPKPEVEMDKTCLNENEYSLIGLLIEVGRRI